MSQPPDNRKHALLLVHRIPWPPDKGDKIRSWRLFRYLAGRYRLSCGFFVDDPDDMAHVEYLAQFCDEVKAVQIGPRLARLRSLTALASRRPMTFDFYRSRAMKQWVDGVLAEGVDAAFGFSAAVMPYLEQATCPVFADLVDADSAKWASYAERASLPMSALYAREGSVLANAEAAISRRADHTFLITPEEAMIVKSHKLANPARIGCYGNGVDTDYFDPAADFAPLDRRVDLIFTGAMDYQPNVEAVTWFADAVWPQLRKAMPDIIFAIVGARPTEAVAGLAARPGIIVTGRVEDMRPWLAAARIAIAPLQIARGVQNKVLEAMAMARPVVASPGAATGIAATPGEHFFIADGAEAFRQRISALLQDDPTATSIGRAGREHMVATGSWAARLSPLGSVLAEHGI
ncbi:TIGR03087 family PEP-CTERM/XrtA system glycosyltransferase [Aquisalinus flavus]|uniref:Glycosyl transferase n=1 Tax=Aquisalinus flavus TaxID=1526572 RepID=A0A8J2Y349_9PROT|nr:TIGR03087 family PEP-CTERM/XrtA system glycosyltransferase [Aquisalinus flavus]MBD0427192.1 TIGR03087 family PEP-CTERM/XrtA system glycosyltransferase [Aquisalinus flavus]UNE47007.1 TIGR03087 family PEP-CTERM/XrtA system glycosyltransferase [Aquisalinus flavus]GGC99073.1 glycosyl transferase [Aquisalinus flavus]